MDDWELKRMAREHDERAKGAELAKDLANAINSFDNGNLAEGFIEELTCRTHRTLQQNAMGLVLQLISKWAEHGDEGVYDLRNEATVQLCQKIKEVTDDAYLPCV